MPVVLIENFRAVFYAPFYAACTLGAYEAEGLEVELKQAAELGKALQAVTAGEGQVSWGGPLRILAALDKDPKCGYAAFCEVVGRDP
ncbi:MAG TPA: ABC transporter substrate-binding protein, partial [Burkholderiales bacterium]|nr:ABC transporter substrate-binding protein [Burkholderiales bacterium]